MELKRKLKKERLTASTLLIVPYGIETGSGKQEGVEMGTF